MRSMAITGAGAVCSGEIDNPTLEVDTVLIEDGLIKAVGVGVDFNPDDST